MVVRILLVRFMVFDILLLEPAATPVENGVSGRRIAQGDDFVFNEK